MPTLDAFLTDVRACTLPPDADDPYAAYQVPDDLMW